MDKLLMLEKYYNISNQWIYQFIKIEDSPEKKEYLDIFSKFCCCIRDDVLAENIEHYDIYFKYLSFLYRVNSIVEKNKEALNEPSKYFNFLENRDFILSDGFFALISYQENKISTLLNGTIYDFENVKNLYSAFQYLDDSDKLLFIKKIIKTELFQQIINGKKDIDYFNFETLLNEAEVTSLTFKLLKDEYPIFFKQYLEYVSRMSIINFYKGGILTSRIKFIINYIPNDYIEIRAGEINELLFALSMQKNKNDPYWFNLFVSKINKKSIEDNFNKNNVIGFHQDPFKINKLLKNDLKLDVSYDIIKSYKNVNLYNFNLQSQFFILDINLKDSKSLVSDIIKNNFFEYDQNNLLNLNTEHKELIKMNFET